MLGSGAGSLVGTLTLDLGGGELWVVEVSVAGGCLIGTSFVLLGVRPSAAWSAFEE